MDAQGFAAGKSVVTANKQLIAYRGAGLARLAAKHGVQLVHGAAVAGGVPVIPGMLQGLSGDQITRISGIVNGTCNYILSRMEAGAGYAAVLADAQALGYAEADPSADVDGFDARAKLCILSRIAMHAELDPDAVATQTISTVEAIDFAYAKELNCTIRQVSRAQMDGTAGACARGADAGAADVADCVVAWDAEHGGDERRFGGDVVFSRARRGRRADGGRGGVGYSGGGAGLRRGAAAGAAAEVTGEFLAPHYLRFVVDDRPGIVCGDLRGRWPRSGANIDSLLQHPGHPKHRLPFVVTTEPCLTSTIEKAVASMAKMDCMLERPLCLQILVPEDKPE